MPGMDDIQGRIGDAAKQFGSFVKRSAKSAAKWLEKQADDVGFRGKEQGFRATAKQLGRIITGKSLQIGAADRAKDFFATLGSLSVKGIVAGARGTQRLSRDMGYHLDKAVEKGYKQAKQRLAQLRSELPGRVSDVKQRASQTLHAAVSKVDSVRASVMTQLSRSSSPPEQDIEIQRGSVTLAPTSGDDAADAFTSKLGEALRQLSEQGKLSSITDPEPEQRAEGSQLSSVLSEVGAFDEGELESDLVAEDEDDYENESSDLTESTASDEAVSSGEASSKKRARSGKSLARSISSAFERLSSKRARVAVELPNVEPSQEKQPDAELQELLLFSKSGQKLVFNDEQFELIEGRRSKADTVTAAEALLARVLDAKQPYSATELGPMFRVDRRLAKAFNRSWAGFVRMPQTLQVINEACQNPSPKNLAALQGLLGVAAALGPKQSERLVSFIEGQFGVTREELKEAFLQHRAAAEAQDLDVELTAEPKEAGTVSKIYSETVTTLREALELSDDFIQRATAVADQIEGKVGRGSVDEDGSSVEQTGEEEGPREAKADQTLPSKQKASKSEKEEAGWLREMIEAQEKVGAGLRQLLSRLPETDESGGALDASTRLTILARALYSPELKACLEQFGYNLERQDRFDWMAGRLLTANEEAKGAGTLKKLYQTQAFETLGSVIAKPLQTGPRIELLARSMAEQSEPFKALADKAPLSGWMGALNERKRFNELLAITV